MKEHNMINQKNSESGAASLLIVIFMAIILSIVTIGFVRIAINEQRSSTDDDLTARAYYAAESGIEDARRATAEVLTGTLLPSELNGNTCEKPSPNRYNTTLSPVGEFDIEYTCQLIDFTPDTITAEFSSANQTRQYEINPVTTAGVPSGFNSFTLDWHIDAAIADGGDGEIPGDASLRGAGAFTIPEPSAWNSPAMMEVSFISYPNTGTFNESQIDIQKILVSPNATAAPTHNITSSDGRVRAGGCSGNPGDTACSVEFVGFSSSRNYEVRITNLYAETTIELEIRSGANRRLFADAQARADVTGRSGEVFRRVEVALDLNNIDLLPSFTIQSATDVCKDFSFTNVAGGFDGQNFSSCTR